MGKKTLESFERSLDLKRQNDHYNDMCRDQGFPTRWRLVGYLESLEQNPVHGSTKGNDDAPYRKLEPGIYEAVTKNGELRDKGKEGERYSVELLKDGSVRPIPPPIGIEAYGRAQSDCIDFLMQNDPTTLKILKMTHSNPSVHGGLFFKGKPSFFSEHFAAMKSRPNAKLEIQVEVLAVLLSMDPVQHKQVMKEMEDHNKLCDKAVALKEKQVTDLRAAMALQEGKPDPRSDAAKAKAKLAEKAFVPDLKFAKLLGMKVPNPDDSKLKKALLGTGTGVDSARLEQVIQYIDKQTAAGHAVTYEGLVAKQGNFYSGTGSTKFSSGDMAKQRSGMENKQWVQDAAKLGMIYFEANRYANFQNLTKREITMEGLRDHLAKELGEQFKPADPHDLMEKVAVNFMAKLNASVDKKVTPALTGAAPVLGGIQPEAAAASKGGLTAGTRLDDQWKQWGEERGVEALAAIPLPPDESDHADELIGKFDQDRERMDVNDRIEQLGQAQVLLVDEHNVLSDDQKRDLSSAIVKELQIVENKVQAGTGPASDLDDIKAKLNKDDTPNYNPAHKAPGPAGPSG